jgi:hypothetical protein
LEIIGREKIRSTATSAQLNLDWNAVYYDSWFLLLELVSLYVMISIMRRLSGLQLTMYIKSTYFTFKCSKMPGRNIQTEDQGRDVLAGPACRTPQIKLKRDCELF